MYNNNRNRFKSLLNHIINYQGLNKIIVNVQLNDDVVNGCIKETNFDVETYNTTITLL